MVERAEFREVMARFASGVVVVTIASEAGYRGVTISSFCSVSLDPPLVLICIDRSLQSHDLVRAAPAWAINILDRSQTFFAEQFSGQTPLADPTFSRVPHHIGELGAPLIDGCLGWLECRPWAAYDGGDHTIFVGEVAALGLGRGDDPLIYFDRRFTELSWG